MERRTSSRCASAPLADGATHQQQVRIGAGIDEQPVIQPVPFAAFAGREVLPAACRRGSSQFIGPLGVGGDEPCVAGHCHDVVEVLVIEPVPQPGVVAVGLIGGEPRHRGPAVLSEQPLQHLSGQLGFGGEGHVWADPGLGAPLTVLGPGLGQVQLAVDQRPTAGGA